MATKKSKWSEYIRIAEYLFSGGAYFWTGYLVFLGIDKGLHGSFFWAKSLSTLTGWLVNYGLQRYLVFKNNKLKEHQTEVNIRYAVITLIDFVLDYFIVFWLKGIGITPYIGQFASAGFFTIWNYLWYRFWVFPTKFTKHKAMLTAPRILTHRAHGHSAYQKVKHA